MPDQVEVTQGLTQHQKIWATRYARYGESGRKGQQRTRVERPCCTADTGAIRMTQQHDGPSLLPCPFCGGEPQPALIQGGGIEWAQVECVDRDCGAVGPTPATEAEAIAAWNDRPTQPQADDRAEIVRWLRAQSDKGAEVGIAAGKETTRRAAFGGGSLALHRAADAIERGEHLIDNIADRLANGETESQQPQAEGLDDLIRRVEYILDPSASASERTHRRSHLTNHDLRCILRALRSPEPSEEMVEKEALRQRAAMAEHRLLSFRQHHAARGEQLRQFIKDRAPELWSDYAAISVNGSVYSDDYTLEPVFERELNILRHRAEEAEARATKAEAALSSLSLLDR